MASLGVARLLGGRSNHLWPCAKLKFSKHKKEKEKKPNHGK